MDIQPRVDILNRTQVFIYACRGILIRTSIADENFKNE
jgi:hypothetical protein